MAAQEARRCHREALPRIGPPAPRVPARAIHREHRALPAPDPRGRMSSVQLERNKELVRRAWAAYDRGDEEGFAACVTDDWVERDAKGGVATLADARESMALQRTAFPDKHTAIVQMVAEGDLVVTRTVTTATHRG